MEQTKQNPEDLFGNVISVYTQDQAIEDGIGEKRSPDLLIEHDHDEGADGEEHHHPDEKNPGRGELKWIDLLRHGQRPYLDSQ